MKKPRKLTLPEVEQRVSAALKAIEPCFIPEARLTLVMRVPGQPEQEACFTRDDDPREVVAAFQRCIARAEKLEAPRG